MKNRNFPYPLKTDNLTVYGIKGCPYCAKMKDIAENVRGSVYHDIDELINKGFAKSFADFKRIMKPFINNYDMVPMVFIEGGFIKGYNEFVENFSSLNNKKKNTLSITSNSIKKEENKLLRLLDGLSKRNRPRKIA